MDELTPEQLEAILGTDYETVLADLLRQKASAEERSTQRREIGQVGDGQVFLDPAGAISNYVNRRRANKAAETAQTKMDEILAKQKEGRRTYAQAFAPKPAPQMQAPRSVDSTVPGQAPAPVAQAPIPGAPQMAPGAPPALANASQMSPDRLQRAGVPAHVQALLAKLRGQ